MPDRAPRITAAGLGLALLAGVSLAAAPPAPVFEPVVVPAHSYEGGWEFFVGGGVAVFDCDGDASPELYLAGGAAPAQLWRNRSEPGKTIAFAEQTPPALAMSGVTGAYPLDIDSDGHMDLAILRVGENVLMRGDGRCGFSRLDLPGFDGRDRWTTAFSATWEPGQRLPTMAFGNYVNRDDPKGPFEACDANNLFRARGARLEHVALAPGWCPLSMLFSDWSRSGRADLRISNDRHYYVAAGEEQMWAMEEPPRLLTEADGWKRYRLWGMGIASRDLTGDGRPEVMMTSMGDQRLQLFTGPGARWEDAPFEMGTTAHRPYTGGDGRPSTGWHVAFGDVNNDGRDDIFIAKGNVQQMPDAAMDDPNNLLVQGPDGRFVEMGARAGVASLARGRGGALADLDLDGRLDLVVVNRRGPAEVWRNVTADAGNWLSIEPRQPGANTRAVGAFIELEAGPLRAVREITVGGGHAGGAEVPEHFGLGAQARARLRILWPDGLASDWVEVEAGQAVRAWRDGQRLRLEQLR